MSKKLSNFTTHFGSHWNGERVVGSSYFHQIAQYHAISSKIRVEDQILHALTTYTPLGKVRFWHVEDMKYLYLPRKPLFSTPPWCGLYPGIIFLVLVWKVHVWQENSVLPRPKIFFSWICRKCPDPPRKQIFTTPREDDALSTYHYTVFTMLFSFVECPVKKRRKYFLIVF